MGFVVPGALRVLGSHGDRTSQPKVNRIAAAVDAIRAVKIARSLRKVLSELSENSGKVLARLFPVQIDAGAGGIVYEFGPFRIDPHEQVLWREGKVVPLSPKLFDTLLVLVQKSGHLVDKDEMLRRVWPDSFVEEGNLTKNVFLLRKILENGHDVSYIETVPKRGYRFVAGVKTTGNGSGRVATELRSEEHTSELQSLRHLVCRLLLEKKKKKKNKKNKT